MPEHQTELLWSHIYWLSILDLTGSYTAAAKRLGVSKSAVSLRITALERVSGVALVRRTTRSIRLTEAGKVLVENTRQAFTSIERGFNSIRDLTDVPRGIVRVSLPVALGRQKIIPLISKFLHDYPDVRLEIELSDHLSSLDREGFDVAIRHTDAVPEAYVAWHLQTSKTLLVATPHYLEKHGTPKTLDDLALHNCLYYLRSATAPVWFFSPTNSDQERQAVAVRGNFCANNSEAIREMVMADIGIALLPDFSAEGYIHAKQLIPLLPQWKPVGVFGDAIYAIRPYNSYVPQAVRVFVKHLQRELRTS